MLIAREALVCEPLLSRREETELALQIEAGVLAREVRLTGRPGCEATEIELIMLEEQGERARQRYIRGNLRLVAKVASQAAVRSRLSEGDLFQEGCVGLIHAVERFDCRRGNKFSTYASFWIRAYVGAATANLLGSLNLPTSRAAKLRALRGVEAALAQSLGRPASLSELATAVGRSEKWAADVLSHQAPQPFNGFDGDWLLLAEPDVSLESVLDQDRPGADLLWHLDGLDRQVVALRFGFADGTAHTYADIARALDLSVSRVRRVERRALEVLRGVCPQSAYVHL